MITKKQRAIAGLKKLSLGVMAAILTAIVAATARQWLDAGEPVWPFWALFGAVVLVAFAAGRHGYVYGPVVEKVNGLKVYWHDFDAHVPPGAIMMTLESFFHRWEQSADTLVTNKEAWERAGKYRLHIVKEMSGASGKHFGSARRIELIYSQDTLRYEFGHMLMTYEHELRTDDRYGMNTESPDETTRDGIASPNEPGHEGAWFKWREQRMLL